MPPYRVAPVCTVEDAISLSQNNMRAFWGQTWWRMLWVDKSLDTIIENCIKRMPRNLLTDRAVRRHEKVIDSATGTIVGYSRWILPSSHVDSWLEAQVSDVTAEARKLFDARSTAAEWSTRDDMPGFDDPLDEMMQKHAPKSPHIKLDYLAVSPDYQRQGIGSRLVESGIQQANKLGLEIFLVAMGGNALAMYQKYGFKLIDQNSQDLRPWGFDDSYDTYILIKQPEVYQEGGAA